MASVKRFEDLLCWQRSRELTKAVYSALRNCDDNGFKDQIQRAAVSVMSNIAEGFESGTREEFINYLFIAKASAGEVRAQTYAALDAGYLNIQTFKYLNGLAEECSRLLSSFIQKVKAGAMSGVQRKKEYREDPITVDLRSKGYVMTPKGLRQRSEAMSQGLEYWEVGTAK